MLNPPYSISSSPVYFYLHVILSLVGNGKLKPNKTTDSGTVVTERATLIRSNFCIVINFLELTCLLDNTVKASFWFQTSKFINKLSFNFLFTGIKMTISIVFTFKNEIL